MAATADLVFLFKVAEDVASPLGRNNTFNDLVEKRINLSGLTTPVVDTPYVGQLSLSAGALTVDLTSLARTGRSALDLTGQIVYGFLIENLGANDMTFVAGAISGYGLFSATNGTVVGANNGLEMGYTPAGYGTVGASALNIDVSGTAAQSFNIMLITGSA